MRLCVLTCVMLGVVTFTAGAGMSIWSEDFSDVSAWSILHDPGGGSTITTDGSRGLFYVHAAASEAAFATSDRIPFDPMNRDSYVLSLWVDSLTGSTSYDIAMDSFNASLGWLGTVWNVFPESGTTVLSGETHINMGTFSFHPDTAYLAPKIGVYTGYGEQTVYFNTMAMEVIPEPSAGLLLGIMGTLLWAKCRWC